jgi:hypothetical protein
VFECRELRLQFRRDGKAAPAHLADKPDDEVGAD